MKKVLSIVKMASLAGLALTAFSCSDITTNADNFAVANNSARSAVTKETVTLTSDLNPGFGKAVYFAGTFDGNWATAFRGTYSDSDGWTIAVNATETFEWKTLTGSYDLGESVSRTFNGLSVSGTTTEASYSQDVGFGNAVFFAGDVDPTTAYRGYYDNGSWKLDAASVYGSDVAISSYTVYTGSWDLGDSVKGYFANLTWTEGDNNVYEISDPVSRRALAFANVDGGAIQELDIISLEKMFNTQTFDGKKMDSVERIKNYTMAQIKEKIRTTFADTDDNDVSYIVMSCHGSSAGGIYIGTDGYFTGATLRQTLDDYVKGEVVVMIDCCFAGQAINKDAEASEEDVDAFVNQFVSDFAASVEKSGELASERFHVLCAANKSEYSYGGTVAVGIGAWEKGLGWNATGNVQLDLNADSNGDNKVTMAELHAYSAPLTAYCQHQVVYPEDDQLVIGGRY